MNVGRMADKRTSLTSPGACRRVFDGPSATNIRNDNTAGFLLDGTQKQEENIEWKNSASQDGCSIKVAYDRNSTDFNPVMYVETSVEGITKAYRVEITKVDPRNATKIEMMALATYKYRNNPSQLDKTTKLLFHLQPSLDEDISKFAFEERSDFVALLRQIPESAPKDVSLAETPSMDEQKERKKEYQALAAFLSFLEESPRLWVF